MRPVVSVILLLAATTALSDSPSEWKEAAPGYRYSFPRDHAAHEDYRIEWWYYTGNLQSARGRLFGYQLTFFRSGMVRRPENPSRWALRDLYLAHFAISDIEEKSFRSYERISRKGVGWAGAETASYRVWNADWEAKLADGEHLLVAREGDSSIALKLRPSKPPVIHGRNGISRKGSSAGNASHYYSISRMRTSGTIRVAGESHEVEGLSWMDHEFGTAFLEDEQVGWDWFSLQLEDGRDLMLFQIRRSDGTMDPRSSGTLIGKRGEATPIAPGTFALEAGRTWRSPATGGAYPVAWKLSVPALDLELEVDATFPAQELRTPRSTGVSYWEGSIRAAGRSRGREVRGRGYLEMTGYAGRRMSEVFR